MDAYKQEYDYLGIAMGGVYGRGPSKWSKDGFSVSIPDKRLSPYYGDLIEGGIVVDKRPCIEKDEARFVNRVYLSPLLKKSLPPKTMCKLFEKEEPCEDVTQCGPIDYISMDLYLDLWRKEGAKIGKRVGNEIHWENGEVSPIPSESMRWSSVD